MDSNIYDSNEKVINLTRRYIDNTIQRLLKTSETFSYETLLKVSNTVLTHIQSRQVYKQLIQKCLFKNIF